MTRKKRMGLCLAGIAAAAIALPASGLAVTPIPEPPNQPQPIFIEKHILEHAQIALAIGPLCLPEYIANAPDVVLKGGREQK